MSSDRKDIKIANVKVNVPIYEDEQSTEDLVQWLDELFDRMVKDVGRLDTPTVALRTAYELAMRLHQAEAAAAGQDEATRKALSTVADQLERLAARHKN